MDAFFVSCELLRRPELRGRPVVVATGTDPHARGVVMAASYEARRYGVRSAVPLAVAHRRCPGLVLVPRDIGFYRARSAEVMAILRRFSDSVEVAGLDEAYLDLSPSPTPNSRARALKVAVRTETGLVCSIGIGPNKLVAKIASDLEKPDGFCVLDPRSMLERVGSRPAFLIPGVGPKTYERLDGMGIRTVKELAVAPQDELEQAFGPRLGALLRDRANGIDERLLETERVRKSESRETTFSHDVSDPAVLRQALARLARSVCDGLEGEGLGGRTVTLKLRLAPFRTHTRSRTLERATRDPDLVERVAAELLERFAPDAPLRLIGIGISSLERESGDAPQGAAASGELLLPI